MGKTSKPMKKSTAAFEEAIAAPPSRAAVTTIQEARRAKIRTVASLNDYVADAVAAVVEVMETGNNKEKLAAAKIVLEYVAGKPTEIRFDNGEGAIHTLSKEEYEDVTVDEKKREKIQKMIEKRYRGED